MSLDLTLTRIQRTEVFDAHITHNLTEMADAVGIYKPIWRPKECGIKTASDMIPYLTDGIAELKREPEKYRELEPDNKWGTYENFVPWLERYLAACEEYPDAEIHACR
jgi:hypothetical protein